MEERHKLLRVQQELTRISEQEEQLQNKRSTTTQVRLCIEGELACLFLSIYLWLLRSLLSSSVLVPTAFVLNFVCSIGRFSEQEDVV